MIHKTAIN